MLHTLKFLHVFLGTLFLGGLLFSSVFLSYFIAVKNNAKLLSLLKFSFILDVFFAILIINQFITGTLLVHQADYTFRTLWIDAAYIFLSLTTILLACAFLIKLDNYRSILANKIIYFKFKKTFFCLNFLIIIIIIFIIRDAVLKSTLL